MLFTEPRFFLFFAAYLALHFLLPLAYRIWLIILGGLAFYAYWRPEYLWVPILLTLIAYYGAGWISSAPLGSRRPRTALTIGALFLPLAMVKYTYFLLTGILGLAFDPSTILNPPETVKWALPLGISFITFTAFAYVIDVARGRYAHEPKLRHLLGHIVFFPHLIAGPILRPHELIPRLKAMRAATDARFMLGLSIFTLGLVKKTVFADQIAGAVEAAYVADSTVGALGYIAAIYGFAVQIYCDFSGYTDMAIGLALIIGMRLPNNFLRPYSAPTVTEFWRRWHITLSHWLRDYLYIPLGGNRLGRPRQLLNLLITMVLGGLWHGANWTFVLWGFLHGVGLAASHSLMRGLRLPGWIAVALTFHWVTALWILFRAPNLETAMRVALGPFTASWDNASADLAKLAFPLGLVALFLVFHRFDRHAWLRVANARVNAGIRLAVIATCWIIAIAVSQGSSAKFIYFDF